MVFLQSFAKGLPHLKHLLLPVLLSLGRREEYARGGGLRVENQGWGRGFGLGFLLISAGNPSCSQIPPSPRRQYLCSFSWSRLSAQ